MLMQAPVRINWDISVRRSLEYVALRVAQLPTVVKSDPIQRRRKFIRTSTSREMSSDFICPSLDRFTAL